MTKALHVATLGCCLIPLCASLAPAATPPIDAAVARIVANPRAVNGTFAIEFYDLDEHRVLYALNPHTFVTAASTTKLVTEGTTLTMLGPGFRWTTPVYRRGSLDAGGTLHGDLVLVASGDPDLSQRIQRNGTLAFENEDHAYDGSPASKAVPGDPLLVLRELATQVRAAGITRVAGRVVVDSSLFPDSSEGGTDTRISPIVVNDNLIDVTVTPGAHAGDTVSFAVSPETPYATFTSTATTAASPKVDSSIGFTSDVTDANGNHAVTITGKIPPGPSILYAYRIENPKRFAEVAFTKALDDAGVAVQAVPSGVPGTAGTSATPGTVPSPAASDGPRILVARHVSPPLSEDVYITLKVSQNLHAALMPYMWAVYGAHAHEDQLAAGFKFGAHTLERAGVDLHGASMEDGEGAATLFTADWMIRYLAWAHRQPWYPALFRGLPIMGVDGTLAEIQKSSPARGKVFAKTGTLGSENLLRDGQVISKGLAGFMTTSHGRHIAFALYLDHIEGPASENTATVAGEILGSLATAAYRTL